MQSILFELHDGMIVKDNQVDIIDGSHGFEKFIHGGKQRGDRMALLHRK